MVDQGLFHVQSQQLRQEQIIAPHQIQSLEILQMPLQDLYSRIQEELAGNPVMELGPEAPDSKNGESQNETTNNESDAQPSEPSQTEFGEQLLGDPLAEMSGPGSNTDDAAGAAAEKDEFLAGIMQIEEGWRDYAPPSQGGSRSSDDDEKRRFFFDSLTTETTLEEELLAQLRTSDSDPEIMRLGELVIGSIDPTGYLKTPIEELSRASGSTEARMTEALKLIQSFEPAGVGARDLRECLLLQLERDGRKESLEWRIVDRHLTQVARNRLPALARTLRTTLTEIAHTVEAIRKLQPRPGSGIGGGAAHFVQPDVVIVFNENGELEASAHERSLPRVRISKMYRQLLESKDTPSETRKYIREKVLGVKTLQRSLMQRESTIKMIADAIVRHQEEFFTHGDDRMVPLTMTKVAEEIGVHETTVSRAIAHKYVDTPRGLLPLRHFFSSGYVTEDGEQLSNLAVKSKLQALVDHEDPQKPLSDQKLVDMLRAEGFDVARRTVAKYRDELQIPSSHLRRQHGI